MKKEQPFPAICKINRQSNSLVMNKKHWQDSPPVMNKKHWQDSSLVMNKKHRQDTLLVIRKDIPDIMKAVKLLNASQKQEIIDAINNLKATKED